MKHPSDKIKGIIFIILAALGFSLMSVFVRLSGENLPTFEKAFFRNAVALIFMGALMAKKHISFRPEKGNVKFMLLRSLFGTIGLVCNFYALDRLVLADANMLNKLSPFFAILFSFFILKEKPRLIQLCGTVVAFLGSLLIIKPSFNNTEVFASVIGFLGGAMAGAAYTFVRALGAKGEPGTRIIFFFSAFSTLFCLPFMLFEFVMPAMWQLLCLILAGTFACLGQFGITKAYLFAPAKEISVYDYTQVIFAAIFGFFIFDQTPDIFSILGYVMICGAGVWMFFINKSKDKKAV